MKRAQQSIDPICFRPNRLKTGLLASMALMLVATAFGGIPAGQMRNGTVVFYGPGQLQPDATVQIGIVRKTHQRRGFFRIGALPAVRLENVTVEIAHPQNVQATLGRIQTHFRVLGNGARVELRNLRITVSRRPAIEIKSDQLILDSDGIWQLRGQITISIDGISHSPKSASLTATGTKAGELTVEKDGGTEVINLFSTDHRNASGSQPHHQL